MTARRDEIDQATKWLERMRGRLQWLMEDGFVETKARVLPAHFALRFQGPRAAISISVIPGRSEIEIFLKERDASGHGPALWEYLEARGLPALSERIDATSDAAVDAAIDEHAAALKLLRHLELAGDWTPLDRSAALADARKHREELIERLIDASRDHPAKGSG
jgi:hypothetical protein